MSRALIVRPESSQIELVLPSRLLLEFGPNAFTRLTAGQNMQIHVSNTLPEAPNSADLGLSLSFVGTKCLPPSLHKKVQTDTLVLCAFYDGLDIATLHIFLRDVGLGGTFGDLVTTIFNRSVAVFAMEPMDTDNTKLTITFVARAVV